MSSAEKGRCELIQNGNNALFGSAASNRTVSGGIAENLKNGAAGHRKDREDCMQKRPTGKVTAKKLKLLLEYQQYRCALTGRELTPENCNIDHIVPKKELDPELIDMCENLQLVVEEVNRAKNTLGNDEFVRLCKDVAGHC